MNGTELSTFPNQAKTPTEIQVNYNLIQEFQESFNLKDFLDSIWKNSLESDKLGATIDIKNYDTLVEFLVRHLKSKNYIGVGVGGVFTRSDILRGNLELVLLYKRYHEPENQVWSMLGGSSQIHERIEDTLRRKINRLTNIPQDCIEVKDIIRANNHEERDKFHYLSPAFYYKLKSISRYLYWGKQSKPNDEAREVLIIEDLNAFSTIDQSTYKEPILAWVPVSLINDDHVDTSGRPLFSYTTCQAIERHCSIREASSKILDAAKAVAKYDDWRISTV